MASGNRITTTGVLYINGQQVENTFQNISRITRSLERDLRRLPPGTREFIDTAQNLRQSRARLEEVRNEINAVTGALEESTGFLGLFNKGLLKFGDTFREVFSANVASEFFNMIIDKGKLTVDQLLEIADAMTDVQKTSGMTLEQVKELWDEFDTMNTRTSKLDRLKIAEIAGRLGVPTEQMKDFVQEIDKAYVALGDSFEGGLEGVVDQLGKMKGLFTTTKEMSYAEAVNRIGSALNTLAAQGVASEGNISQFSLRVGSLPDALKPAIDKVLGLGAAFEESGIDAQIASSGFSNFLSTAGQNIEGFAISMHMSVAEAKNLLNTKPEEFFLRFAQGMKDLPADQTAKVLDSLKLNSLEVQKAIGAASNRTDEFRKSMKTASEEMEKMTSLQDEFNQKNNNAPAIIEKIKNVWSDLFTSTNIINKFEWLIQLLGWFTGVTSKAGDGIVVFKERIIFLWNILKIITATLLSYNTVVLISTIATGNLTKATWLSIVADKAQAVAILLKRTALLLYEVTLGLVTLNINRARIAMIAFNTTAKMNPIGILVALLVSAVVAYKSFSKEVNEAAKKKKILDDITKQASENSAKEISVLDQLYKKATDATKSTKDRTDAVKALKEQFPAYFKNISDEVIMNGKAEESYKSLRNAIVAAAKAKAAQQKLEERAAERLERDEKINQDIAEQQKTVKNPKSRTSSGTRFSGANELSGGGTKEISAEDVALGAKYRIDVLNKMKAANKKADDAADQFLLDIIDENTKKSEKLAGNTVPQNIPIPDKAKKEKKDNSAKKAAEDLAKDLEESLKAESEANNRSLEAEIQFRIDKLKLQNESYEKEKELANLERSEELNEQRKQQDDILKTISDLEKKKSKAKSPEAKSNYEEALKKQRALLQTHDQIVLMAEETHQLKLKTIREKWNAKKLEDNARRSQRDIENKRRDREQEITDITSLEDAKAQLTDNAYLKLTDKELSAIDNLEDAKKALREVANREMLAQQEKAIQQQIDNLTAALNDPAISEEARKELSENLDFLKDKITQVKSAIQGNAENDSKKVIEEKKAAKEKVDILGFSAADWEKAWKDLDSTEGKIRALGMAFQALGNAGQMFSQLIQSQNEKELRQFTKVQDQKRKVLLKQLNEGYINQEEYTKATQQLEVEAANKKAELEYKQAKADKISRLFSAIGATALGVANSLAVGGPAGIVLAAIVGALGAIQVGLIASQPLPEKPSYSFDGGGFTGSGFGSPDASGFKPAGIVHQDEWVAPKWMLEEPRTAKVIDYLESVRTGKTTPMADGGFSSDNTDSSVSSNSTKAESNDSLVQYTAVMFDVKSLLQKLYDEGVIAKWTDDPETGKRMKSAIKKFDKIETRASRK